MTDPRRPDDSNEAPMVAAGELPTQFFSSFTERPTDNSRSEPPPYTRRPSIRETRIGFNRDAWENPPLYSPPAPTTSDRTHNQQERDATLTSSQAPLGSSPVPDTSPLPVRDSRSTTQERARSGSPGIPPPPYTSLLRLAPATGTRGAQSATQAGDTRSRVFLTWGLGWGI